MSNQNGDSNPRVSFSGTAQGRIVTALGIVVLLLGIVAEGVIAYRTTQEAITAKATADNANVRQKGEAEHAESHARTQLEIARNAAERQKAEADKAEAEAKKVEAEAGIAESQASNAELKARSDALSIKNEAEIRRFKAETTLAEARAAAVKFKAEADLVEDKNKSAEKNEIEMLRDLRLLHCPGKNAIEKIYAKDEGRCR